MVEIFHIAMVTRILAWPIPLHSPGTPESISRLNSLVLPLASDSPTGMYIPGHKLIIQAWRDAKFDKKYIDMIKHGYMPTFKHLPKSTRRANSALA